MRAAENATPCAWLPADAVITPRERVGRNVRHLVVRAAQRDENTGWLSSRFR
jgi:hypothetical protein